MAARRPHRMGASEIASASCGPMVAHAAAMPRPPSAPRTGRPEPAASAHRAGPAGSAPPCGADRAAAVPEPRAPRRKRRPGRRGRPSRRRHGSACPPNRRDTRDADHPRPPHAASRPPSRQRRSGCRLSNKFPSDTVVRRGGGDGTFGGGDASPGPLGTGSGSPGIGTAHRGEPCAAFAGPMPMRLGTAACAATTLRPAAVVAHWSIARGRSRGPGRATPPAFPARAGPAPTGGPSTATPGLPFASPRRWPRRTGSPRRPPRSGSRSVARRRSRSSRAEELRMNPACVASGIPAGFRSDLRARGPIDAGAPVPGGP